MSALDLLYGPLFDALRGRRPVALLYFFVFVCPLQVKVWNASTGQCLHTATLEAAIISLSFHPSGRMIAMASSLYVYLWDYNVSIVVRGRCVVDRNLDVLRDSLQLSSLLEVRGEKRAVGSFIGRYHHCSRYQHHKRKTFVAVVPEASSRCPGMYHRELQLHRYIVGRVFGRCHWKLFPPYSSTAVSPLNDAHHHCHRHHRRHRTRRARSSRGPTRTPCGAFGLLPTGTASSSAPPTAAHPPPRLGTRPRCRGTSTRCVCETEGRGGGCVLKSDTRGRVTRYCKLRQCDHQPSCNNASRQESRGRVVRMSSVGGSLLS